jgi:phosphatidylserine decarboxylase
MSEVNAIKYYNRTTAQIEEEKVYGEGAVRWLYESKIGKLISHMASRKWISSLYGGLQNTRQSGHKVPAFVKKFDINLTEYQPGSINTPNQEDSYASFNEFFIRPFRQGQRSFEQEASTMPAPCEARYFAWEKIDDSVSIPVKGHYLTARDLLDNHQSYSKFDGGPLVIARLCPVDYHRYHYPDDGETEEAFFIHGDYHSVNPIALKYRPDIFIKNERRVSFLETKNFGTLAYIEVGAICVGKIVQSHDEGKPFKRGDQKGYFLFGGSTVVLLGEPGKWKPDEDILNHTKEGIETYLKIGQSLAKA